MAAVKKGLGSKGLGIDALIHSQIEDFNQVQKADMEIDINKIEPNRSQPRRNFDEKALEELASSIRQYGIIQPLIVKKIDDYYEIIAGERRWRGAKIAGLTKVPVIIKDYKDVSSYEIALIENIQRENLNPMEEAAGYKKIAEELHISQEEIAEKVGKSRSAVANFMRLLNLDSRVQNFIIENKISAGHAKALLSIEDKNMQFELAEKIIEEELSVRATEQCVKALLEKKEKHQEEKITETIFKTESYKTLENDLKTILGTKVKLNAKKNKGKIEIEYYSDEDLDRIIGLIKK